jgi:hypothetical protein
MAYNVTKRFREIVYSGGAIYKCSLKINNKLVPNRQIAKITISNPIIDTTSDYFYVGSYIAQKLTIKFKNLDNLDIKSNNNISLDISLDVDGIEVNVPIGKFLIDDLSENYYESCEITCLDYSVKAKNNIDYSPCFVDGKAKIDTIFEYICNFFSITFDPNYPKTNGDIEVGIYDSTVSGKRYISYIAELKGCNAKHGRDGILYLIPLKQTSNVSINALKSKSWKLGEKFQISGVSYDDGARPFKAGDTTNNTLFIRSDNPFVKDQTMIDNIYNVVKDTIIWNLKTENYGDISLDPWDNISYQLGKETYNTLMNVNLTYEMNISSTNEIKLPTKQQEQTTNVVGGDIQSRLLRVGRTIDLINGEIKDLSEKVVDISSVASGVGFVNITNGYKGNLHKLDIYGYMELPIVGGQLGTSPSKVGISKVGYAITKTYKKYIKPLIVGEFKVNNFYLFVEQNGEVLHKYILPVKYLYSVGSVHDEFNYLEGKCSILRRIGVHANGVKYVLAKPYTEELPDLIIEVPEGDYKIYTSYEALHLNVEYLTQNQYTSTFATQVDVQSSIKIATDEVLIESKREILGNGDALIASINTKSTGEVLIDATKAINFNSAEFNVTTEKMKITIGEGENKKDIINANGVLTNLQFKSSNEVWGIGQSSNYFLGFSPYINDNDGSVPSKKSYLQLDYDIPENFVVQNAYVTIFHTPVNWEKNTSVKTWGYCRNLGVYNVYNSGNFKVNSAFFSEGQAIGEFNSTAITNVFGNATYWTARKPSNSSYLSESVTTKDIASSLNASGHGTLLVQSNDTPPYSSTIDGLYTENGAGGKTGSAYAILNIIGYTKV